MRIHELSLLILGLAVASANLQASGIEGGLGGEAHGFRFQDVAALSDFADPFDENTVGALAPELDGTGWRAHGWLGPKGRPDRFEAALSRVSADDTRKTTIGQGSFPGIDLSYGAGTEVTSLDLFWSHEIVGQGGYTLRSQVGYRYLRSEQTSDFSLAYAAFPSLHFDAEQQLNVTGHGLRAGFETGVRLAGPVRLQAVAGVTLLAAGGDGHLAYDSGDFGDRRVEAPFERKRTSLTTWDLATRLLADFGPVTASVGYRFERWDDAGFARGSSSDGVPLSQTGPPAYHGVVAGLALRFGRP